MTDLERIRAIEALSALNQQAITNDIRDAIKKKLAELIDLL